MMGVAPPATTPEPEWGFDDAQLETARAATATPRTGRGAAVPAQKRRSGGRYGLLVALMIIAIVGAAGYFGFRWWEGRQATSVAAVAPQPATPAPVTTTTAAPAPAETGTIVETTPTDTVALTVTPAPVPATATIEPAPTQALPRVTARSTAGSDTPAATPGRERIDAMAREFAANASGNFTVQIQILCDASNVEKLMRSGGQSVWFVPQTIGGTRSCYRVFWGRYNTREQAQQALAQIPAGVRDRNAAVKPVPKG